jgi:hypothetical protein
MSQDNGAKKDTSQIAQEETKSWIENRKEDDSQGPDDKTLPPQTDQKLAEDTPPPSSGHHLSGCAILYRPHHYRRHLYCSGSNLLCPDEY